MTTPEERDERTDELLAHVVECLEANPDFDLTALVREHEDVGSEVLERVQRLRSAGLLPRSNRSVPPTDALAERYEVLGELGRGGMGRVFEVRDRELDRVLAMKVLDASYRTGAGEKLRRRFLEEARLTARLEHPAIVPIHEIGERDGALYYTMRRIAGRDLSLVFLALRDGDDRWTRERVLGLLLQVSEAVEHAHRRGVVHRDLKPSNVMVGEEGEVYVVDWGISKSLREPIEGGGADEIPDEAAPDGPTTGRTTYGRVLGTPVYMAPEQAAGDPTAIDHRADVYALGAMLYELLAGRTPYAQPPARTPVELRARVLAGPPRAIDELAPAQPAELRAICSRAMAREPGQRYPRAADFSSDLRAYLEGRVVRAYEQGAFAELRKWIGRNKVLAGLAGAVLVVAGLGLGSTTYVYARGNARALAEAQQRRTQEEMKRRLAGVFLEQFESLSPAVARGKEQSVSALLDRYESQLAELFAERMDPRTRGLLEHALGSVHLKMKSLGASEPWLESGLRHLELDDGTRPDELRAARADLGILRAAQGRYDEAVQLFEAAGGAILGGESELPMKLGNLAAVYIAQGRHEEAGPPLRALLEGLGESPEDAELRVKTLTNLAIVARKSGDLPQALELASEALQESEAALGADHPATIDARFCLGVTLDHAHEDERAVEVLDRTLADARRVLGSENALVPRIESALASAGADLGREDALEQLESAARRTEEQLGPDHVTTLVTWLNVAVARHQFGHFEAAIEILEDMLVRADAALDQGHPMRFGLLSNLADAHAALDEHEVAVELLELALAGQIEHLGVEHPNSHLMRLLLSRSLMELGRDAEAQALLDEVFEHSPEDSVWRERAEELRTSGPEAWAK